MPTKRKAVAVGGDESTEAGTATATNAGAVTQQVAPIGLPETVWPSFARAVVSGLSTIWVTTPDPYATIDAVTATVHGLRDLKRSQGVKPEVVFLWTPSSGLNLMYPDAAEQTLGKELCRQPQADLIRAFQTVQGGYNRDPNDRENPQELRPMFNRSGMLVTVWPEEFLEQPVYMDAVARAAWKWADNPVKWMVVLASTRNIPTAISSYFHPVTHERPATTERELIWRLLTRTGATQHKLKGEEHKAFAQKLAVLSAGLTTHEHMQAFRLAQMTAQTEPPVDDKPESKIVSLPTVRRYKIETVKRTSLLEWREPRPVDHFDYLGGMDVLKGHGLRMAKAAESKGILMLGVPGTGKTSFALALAGMAGLPMVVLRFGRLYTRTVGDSEKAAEHVVDMLWRMGRIVLVVDEIEKQFAGAARSSADTDSGVGLRMLEIFLDYMERQQQAIILGTCNNIALLPPEFHRAGRWDAFFFVDVPTENEREAIWNIWQGHYHLEGQERPDDTDWTGAEISTCCRTAHNLWHGEKNALIQAGEYIVPIVARAREQITALRQWARVRAKWASSEADKEWKGSEGAIKAAEGAEGEDWKRFSII